MLVHLPDPYPDELFAGICARYSNRMQYRTGESVARDLFGHEKHAKVSFPNGLGKLVARLPPNPHYTTSAMISNHTFLPFYQPFLPNARLSQVKSMMEADEEKHISVRVGLRGRALPKGYLRFCSHCVEEDRRQF